MPLEYQTPAIEDRAIEVQLRLADLGHHRAPSVADLIVAATAELAGLTVVHLDKDFEMIAEVTAQPIRAPRRGDGLTRRPLGTLQRDVFEGISRASRTGLMSGRHSGTEPAVASGKVVTS